MLYQSALGAISKTNEALPDQCTLNKKKTLYMSEVSRQISFGVSWLFIVPVCVLVSYDT